MAILIIQVPRTVSESTKREGYIIQYTQQWQLDRFPYLPALIEIYRPTPLYIIFCIKIFDSLKFFSISLIDEIISHKYKDVKLHTHLNIENSLV